MLGVPIMVGVSRKRFIADLLFIMGTLKGFPNLRLPPATPSPLASLARRDGPPPADEGAREARGAGGVVVGPKTPVGGAGGLPTRAIRPPSERVFGTAAAVAVAIMNGADAVRVTMSRPCAMWLA